MRVKALTRRGILGVTVSLAALVASRASAQTYSGSLPWLPGRTGAPAQVEPNGWTYFSPEEAAAIEALVDRLIPSDDLSPGGKDAGIAVYIDRQLSGGFGRDAGLYMKPPFADGLPGQGPQSPLTPAERYRASLAALDAYCRAAYLGKVFADIPTAEQDKLIGQMEAGKLQLRGVSSKAFFQVLWQNTKEGFFADPVYGGNRDMVGWKMIGFPGARYDYRDWIGRHNEPYPRPPIGIAAHPDWSNPA
jgi:gluconate 2-dehydrogenase gamma chain